MNHEVRNTAGAYFCLSLELETYLSRRCWLKEWQAASIWVFITREVIFPDLNLIQQMLFVPLQR